MDSPTRDELSNGLRAAGSAHHEYESNALKGERDDHWPGWYAAYLIGRLGDFVTPSALARWLAEAPASDDWPVSAARYIEERLGSS